MFKRRRKNGGGTQSKYLSLQKRSNQAKVLGVLDEPEMIQNECRKTKPNPSTQLLGHLNSKITLIGNCLLLSESLLFLLTPHVHHLPVFVHLHGVVHQAVHVDELDALLLSVEQHRRDDGQLAHLLLCVLTITSQQASSVWSKGEADWGVWSVQVTLLNFPDREREGGRSRWH